jgi:hypothetical protein
MPGLAIAGRRDQHHAALIHALEEIERRDLREIRILGVAPRVGGGGDGEGRASDPHRAVDRLDREVETLMGKAHLVHDVVDCGGVEFFETRRGPGDRRRIPLRAHRPPRAGSSPACSIVNFSSSVRDVRYGPAMKSTDAPR